MTDTDAKNTSDEQHAVSRRSKHPLKKSADAPSAGRVRGGLALILASLALIACGYLWYTVLYQNADLFSMDIAGALDRIESSTNQTQESLANDEKDIKTLKETQDTLRAALEKVGYSGWMTIEGGDLSMKEHSERLDSIVAGK